MIVEPLQACGITSDRFLYVCYDATPEEWENVADESRFVELIDGRLIVHSPVSLTHSGLVGFLHVLLYTYVVQKRLGEVHLGPFTMDVGFARKFEPDIMFIREANRSNLTEDRLRGPADLVIEVASRSTRTYDRIEKRAYYKEAGVGEYWMVDPSIRKVFVDRPAGARTWDGSTGVVTSDVVPGWWVLVDWLWESTLPDPLTCLQELLKETR